MKENEIPHRESRTALKTGALGPGWSFMAQRMSKFIRKGRGKEIILQLAGKSLVRKAGFGRRDSSAPKGEGNQQEAEKENSMLKHTQQDTLQRRRYPCCCASP